MGEWGRGWGQMCTWWTSLAPRDHNPRQHTGGYALNQDTLMSRIPLWSFQFPEIRSPHVPGGMLLRKLRPVVHHLTMTALSGRGVRGMGPTGTFLLLPQKRD